MDSEKAKNDALRKLSGLLIRRLNAQDIKHDLYGKGQLTWAELDQIGGATTQLKANEELLSALRRRGPNVIDVLVECLKEEEDANRNLIEAIRKEWPEHTPPAGIKSIEGVDAGSRALKNVYRMESKPRGLAVIINNRNFQTMNTRMGTDEDAKNLNELFVYLGFTPKYFLNLTTQQMRVELNAIAKADHSKHDALIVAILSHGDEGKLYGTDSSARDGPFYTVEDLGTCFDNNGCPSLRGKPKVFVLQACRGSNYDHGVKAPDFVDGAESSVVISDEEKREQLEKQQQFYTSLTKSLVVQGDMVDAPDSLPTKADILYAYSTIPGYYSWRNSAFGSWFIKSFCDVVKEYAETEHLMDILIEVNRRVAFDFKSSDGSYKQIPGPVCLLTKKLYFRPGP